MSFWTFVCELCGGTYVSQYEGTDISDAIRNWEASELRHILTLSQKNTPKNYSVETDDPDEAVLLGTLHHAYYWSFTLNYKRFGVFKDFKTGALTIVKTTPKIV